MAFGFYFNMEKLALEIANEHLEIMTDDNIYDDIWLDENKLSNNFKNGFVIITQLITFFESFLNSILIDCIEYSGDRLLKCSIEEKIEVIFMHYKKEFKNIKSNNLWENHIKTNRMRNELVHFKKINIGDGGMLPNFYISKVSVKDFFVKSNMKNIIKNYLKLVELIASTLELKIYHKVDIFACDGKSDDVKYVCEE